MSPSLSQNRIASLRARQAAQEVIISEGQPCHQKVAHLFNAVGTLKKIRIAGTGLRAAVENAICTNGKWKNLTDGNALLEPTREE